MLKIFVVLGVMTSLFLNKWISPMFQEEPHNVDMALRSRQHYYLSSLENFDIFVRE